MAGLRQLQNRYSAAILSGQQDVLEDILPGGRLSPTRAIDVYSSGYTARLTEALGETFEAVWRVLGDELFFRVAADYIKSHPSTSYNLSDYGGEFAEYAATRDELKVFPFIRELAEFEWTFKNLFHEREEAALAAARLAQSTGTTRLEFVSSHRLLKHGHQIYPIWKLRQDSQASLPEFSNPERLLLSKKAGDIYVAELSVEEHFLLSGLKAGFTLEDALESGLAVHPHLNADTVTRLFSILAEAGIVRAVS